MRTLQFEREVTATVVETVLVQVPDDYVKPADMSEDEAAGEVISFGAILSWNDETIDVIDATAWEVTE
jgi:uncharacterized membrane protein